jgi:RimJ/RimL family protein N-acetyltransferase
LHHRRCEEASQARLLRRRRRWANRPTVHVATEHEIAYLLGSQWWGRGYATEAAAAIRDHARAQLGRGRLISLIDPENAASKAVATRIGMHHERDLTFEGHPTMLFSCNNGV